MANEKPRGIVLAVGTAIILIAIVLILLSQRWSVQSALGVEQLAPAVLDRLATPVGSVVVS